MELIYLRRLLTAEDDPVRDWYQKWQTQEKDYYLILGRFVPENNYETAIREFMKSSTERDLVIICNHEGNAYFDELRQITGFDKDKRVKFVGTVYDQDLLKYIRNQAFCLYSWTRSRWNESRLIRGLGSNGPQPYL